MQPWWIKHVPTSTYWWLIYSLMPTCTCFPSYYYYVYTMKEIDLRRWYVLRSICTSWHDIIAQSWFHWARPIDWLMEYVGRYINIWQHILSSWSMRVTWKIYLPNIARHHKVPFLLGIKGASKNWPALASRDRGLNILNCISSKGLLGYTLYLL